MSEKAEKTEKKKTKIKTVASKEAARFAEDGEAKLERAPDESGNDFDLRMSEEPDGMKAAEKIVSILKEKGVCVIKANAPPELVQAAFDESEALYEDGEFSPPLRVFDDRSKLEAEVWKEALQSEEKVCYVRKDEDPRKNALRLLMGNMADFGGGLAHLLMKEIGLQFDRYAHPMVCCYSGDKSYHLHIDNPHGCNPDRPIFVDNGARMTLAYFINPDCAPADCAGGLDVCLTDPTKIPNGASEARSVGRFRIAPTADTLVIFLSERMAHQVIATKSKEKLFCMSMWYLNGDAMNQAPRNLHNLRLKMQREAEGVDSDDD